MNSKWLKSFLLVADSGSITAAANEMYISPQALMQQINLLEEETGLNLFTRSHRGMKLSLSGKEFYKGAEQIIQLYENTVERCRLADKAESIIRIPMMSTIIRPKFMEQVCAEYRHRNKNHLEVHFIPDTDFKSRIEQLSQFKYDLIEYYTLDNQCPSDIHFESFFPQTSWCVLSPDNPLSSNESLAPEDFENQTLLLPGADFRLLRYFQMYIETHNINLEYEKANEDRYSILAGLEDGAIYLTSKTIADEMEDYVAVPLNFDTHVYYGFACRKNMKDAYQSIFDIGHELCYH